MTRWTNKRKKRWRERTEDGASAYGGGMYPDQHRAIAEMVIDIVADARELELSETMAALRGRSFGDIEIPTIERSTYAAKDVEVTIGDGVGDPSKFEGFEFSAQMTAAIHSTEVAITAEFIERLWPGATNVTGPSGPLDGSAFRGGVGRFELWEREHGEVWASSGDWGVMVVKPDPELSSDAG